MAVSAPDDAFCNLSFNCHPISTSNQACDFHLFRCRIYVIELQCCNVRLAAVDTRVAKQILPESAQLVIHVALGLGNGLAEIPTSMADIVLTTIRGMAGATVTAQSLP
jgi:hypothetical protein